MSEFTLVAPARANDVSAYIPALWAEAGLIQLSEMMVAANKCYRNFEPLFAAQGNIVNTRRPRDFTAVRKAKTSNITVQDAVADNVQIPLDQHIHTSFLIHDVDTSKSFEDLEKEFIVPAMRSLARDVDLTVFAQLYSYRAQAGGAIGTAASVNSILQTREALTIAKCPLDERSMFVCPSTEADLLALTLFTAMQNAGDTQGLREALIGRKFGFDFFTCQNVPQITATLQTFVTGAVNNGAGYPAATTSLVVDGFTGAALPANCYITIAGDMQIQRVVSASLTSTNTTGIVITPGLKTAVVDNAVITKVKAGAVNLAAGYAAGWEEFIVLDGLTSGDTPQVGQLVTFGATATSAEYTIISLSGWTVGGGSVLLDRPLSAALADNDVVNFGPIGNFNFAMHKNALALVMRPLAPAAGGGAMSATASDERLGASVRVTMAYDARAQATIVTCDFLMGVKPLDSHLGAVMYA